MSRAWMLALLMACSASGLLAQPVRILPGSQIFVSEVETQPWKGLHWAIVPKEHGFQIKKIRTRFKWVESDIPDLPGHWDVLTWTGNPVTLLFEGVTSHGPRTSVRRLEEQVDTIRGEFLDSPVTIHWWAMRGQEPGGVQLQWRGQSQILMKPPQDAYLRVQWIGDLDGDGHPDLLLEEEDYDGATTTMLYLSGQSNGDGMVGLAANHVEPYVD